MSSGHHPSQSSAVLLKGHTLYRFNECPLSFQDQIYLIFLEQRSSSLPFEVLRDGLSHRFGTNNVELRHVRKLRFLNIMHCGDRTHFHLSLRSDDLCPNGFNCKKDHTSCRRIHVVIKQHICRRDLCPRNESDENSVCHLIHLQKDKMRDVILSIILWIYGKHCREESNTDFLHFTISDEVLIGRYFEIYKSAPFPNMTRRQWKRMVHLYGKYYVDHQYQRQFVDGGDKSAPFLSMWRTDYVKADHNDDRWILTVLRGYGFVIRRVCKMRMEQGTRCRIRPRFHCPFFHLHPKCVALPSQWSHCKDCWYDKEVGCGRWHFSRSDCQKVSV